MIDEIRDLQPIPRVLGDMAAWACRERAAASRCLRRPAYWLSLVAEHGLHVSEAGIAPGSARAWHAPPDAASVARVRAELAERGYVQWRALVEPERCAALARGVRALCQHGWDAAFIGLVDEAWQLAFHVAQIIGGALDRAVRFRGELFAFCVDPTLAAGRARGVPAHRDRPDAGYDRLDGLALPRHCTCWVSLTAADEANGCMYVVPSRADDQAGLAGAPAESARGHALVTSPGDLLAWNGQAVHWGGRHDPGRARGPRIALTFSMTHPQVPSLGDHASVQLDSLPGFVDRLSRVATSLSRLGAPAPGTALDVVLDLLRSPP